MRLQSTKKIRTKEEIAYDYVLSRIQNGEWKPGMHLVEGDLAEELNMSRSPVRLALSRLAGENLILKTTQSSIVWTGEACRA